MLESKIERNCENIQYHSQKRGRKTVYVKRVVDSEINKKVNPPHLSVIADLEQFVANGRAINLVKIKKALKIAKNKKVRINSPVASIKPPRKPPKKDPKFRKTRKRLNKKSRF